MPSHVTEASMRACEDADAMVTGNIRHYAASIEKLKHVCDARKGEPIFGMTMMVFKGRTVLVADTNVEDLLETLLNEENNETEDVLETLNKEENNETDDLLEILIKIIQNK